ncbi:mechanosensitive ion channel family protein [Fibrobacterota bacterium]
MNLLPSEYMPRAFATIVVLFLSYVLPLILFQYVNKIMPLKSHNQIKAKFMMKMARYMFLLLGLIVVISIWGIQIKNLWMLITGVFGIMAIGFFAVWSILSNCVAWLLILTSDLFRIEDTISILPDDISGEVIDMKLFFLVLKDGEGNIIHIPNSMLFQKYIKKINRSSPSQVKEG